ncbi:MAG: DUF4097 family beta strand repeat protein [Acidobacteria bacterium]|nr:DUF4097 family beta strand repeat protein [Acidobacteriota bacterium]MBV9622472.1 DUF4097 family beta strand repeat protein [Acidobacteriota bacterium]
MATSVQVPPPAPPAVPPRPPRSLAGPVVLIAIGILFLLGNMGLVSWHDLGYWFSHYWPLLLILWGVVKLVEYRRASRAGVRAAGIGAGGVILIVFLVVAGLLASEAYRVNWDELRDQMHIQGEVPWFGHTYTYTDELQQEFPPGVSLHVSNERGAISVSASEDNRMHVSVHKRINAERQQDADNWNQSTRPQVTRSGQILTIDANTSGAGAHWVSTNLDISVPRKAALILSTRHGDISIMGRNGNLEVSDQDGDVSVSDLNGSLILNVERSSARISKVSSDVTIRGRANDVSVEDVKGTLTLDGDFMESVKLSRIQKPVSFKTSRTDLDLGRLDGYLNLDSGDLEANGVSGSLRLHTRSKDIMLNGVTSDVHLQNENGAVEIHLNRAGNLEVTNSRGDIRIFVPEKAGFQVDAQARDGEIQSDFSALKITSSDDRAAASGAVNGGGPHMILNNEHGTIEIRAGAAVAEGPSPGQPKAPKAPSPPPPPLETEN